MSKDSIENLPPVKYSQTRQENGVDEPFTAGSGLMWAVGPRLVLGPPKSAMPDFVDESLMIERAGLPPLE